MTYKLAVISILGSCITTALISGSSFEKPVDKVAVISGKYIGVKQPMTILIRDYSHELDLSNPKYIDTITTSSNGHFKVSLTINSPQEIALESDISLDKIFIETGDSLYFESEGKGQNNFQNISGLGSDKLKVLKTIGNRLSLFEMVNMDSAEIIVEFKKRIISRNKVINSLRGQFSEAFVDYVIAKTLFEVDYFFRAFPNYLKTTRKLEFPVDTVAISNADNDLIRFAKKGFNNTDFSNLLFDVTFSKALQNEVDNLDRQFYEYKRIVKEMGLSSNDEQLMLSRFFLNYLKKGKINDVEGYMVTFFKDYPHSIYTQTLRNEFQEWKTLSSGRPAPNFTATQIQGGAFRLSYLKGKVVYIDIWATWCGPCREEFSYSKKLKMHFKDNKDIVFLYVSIDGNKTRWLDYLKKNSQLQGLHVNDSGNSESNISKVYKVTGIPRYVIIDRKGNIFASVANRPSSGDLLVKQLNDALSQ